MLRLCWVTTLLIMLVSAPASWAQKHKRSYEGPGNWFIGIEGGTTHALSENAAQFDVMHVKVPSGSIQLGYLFTPRLGIRATGGVYSQFGYPSKLSVQMFPEMFEEYHFYSAITTVDLLLNLTNCFRPYDVRNWFDLSLVFGGGGLFRFNTDEKVRYWYLDIYPVNSNNFWFWTARVGIKGDWHVARSMDVSAELDFHATDNAYNGVVGTSHPYDVFVSPRLGVVYYFGNSKHRHRFANRQKVHRYWKELNRE